MASAYTVMVPRSRTRELPGNYPFSVKENLILESVRQWGPLAMECFEEVQEIVTHHVDRLIDQHFQKFAPGGLKDEVRFGLPLSNLSKKPKSSLTLLIGLSPISKSASVRRRRWIKSRGCIGANAAHTLRMSITSSPTGPKCFNVISSFTNSHSAGQTLSPRCGVISLPTVATLMNSNGST